MSEVISAEPMPSASVSTSSSGPSVEVFAVYGVEPEIQAYAMAKYSRSALSMKESLQGNHTQKAEKFLNTFYFQYGHRSIADLAHIALAIERLSILAAIVVADEQRWDGQERSTRYQDFKKSGYYTPNFESTHAPRDSISRNDRVPVCGLRKSFAKVLRISGQYYAASSRNEAGRLRAHAAGARL